AAPQIPPLSLHDALPICPTWRLPNELPIAGEPADVYAMLERAHAALASSRYPKLLFAGDPGALVSPGFAERFASGLHDCELVQRSEEHTSELQSRSDLVC